MKHLVKAIVFSVSTALVATSAFAAPQQPHYPANAPQHPSSFDHQQANHKGTQLPPKAHISKVDGPKHKAQQRVEKPSRDWRVGQKLPAKFQAKNYVVNHKVSQKLTKPGNNQQWVYVNGDYVLTNVKNHTIFKIISG